MKLLSLFNGIGIGATAMQNIGVEVETHYISEIDKFANQTNAKHHPDSIQLGDITKWYEWNIPWEEIDIVTAGFPCQAWSMAGQQLGDKDPRGALFWITLDVIREVLHYNPSAKFLMENVRMKKEFEEYITFHTEQALGKVEKTLINSALLTAQNRQRYYWTNFKVGQPEDKGILLKDIIEDIPGDRPCEIIKEDISQGHVANAVDIKGLESLKRVYGVEGKAPTLTTMQGGHRQPKIITFVDREKAHCIDANYFKGGNLKSYFEKRRRQLVFCGVVGGEDIKDEDLQGGAPDGGPRKHYSIEEIMYRKLTPLECERLQGYPDNYTEGVSNTQRYKQIGNGWTLPVIEHIFKEMMKDI